MTPNRTQDDPTSDELSSEGDSPLRHVLLVLAVMLAAVGGWSVSSQFRSSDAPATGLGPMESIDQSVFAGQTGVWIEHVALVGGDGLIEIRYRILDVDKSDIVHDIDNPPRIIAADGFEIRYQRHEHSHSRVNRLGGTYTEQLVNLGSTVHRGEKITVLMGTHALEGVTVQ